MANLSTTDKQILEKLFQMNGGYVLNFSDRTMGEFFRDDLKIDIYDGKFNYASGSKANYMRGFWMVADDETVGNTVLKLIEYIRTQIIIDNLNKTDFPEERLSAGEQIGKKLVGSKINIITSRHSQSSTEKIVRKLKNDEFRVQSNHEGDDEHLFIFDRNDHSGKHVHLVADGQTGEVRIDPKDKSPHDLLEKIITITTRSGIKIRSTKTTLEFLEESSNGSDSQQNAKEIPQIVRSSIPVLDLENVGASGGPNGHFLLFKITNNSQTQKAIDCLWEVRGFNYSFRADESSGFSLQPNFSKEVTYRYDTEKLYQEEVPELSLVMEYKDINGIIYFTRRELKQVRVPSGAFYTLERGGIFYPAEQSQDIGIVGVSEPTYTGGGYESYFEIKSNDEGKMVKITISSTLLAVWGFSEDLSAIKSALVELGSRVIKKMLTKNALKDHLFTTHDFPPDYQNGPEGYRKLRDSL